MDIMVKATENGSSLSYFDRPDMLPSLETLREKNDLNDEDILSDNRKLEETSAFNQLKVLLKRGFLKSRRDSVSPNWNPFLVIISTENFICRLLLT